MTMMHHITLSNGVFAACGVVCNSDLPLTPLLGGDLSRRDRVVSNDIFRYFRWNSFFTLFRKNIR